MAIIGTEDLAGAPTSGNYEPGDHPGLVSDGPTSQLSRIFYAPGPHAGYSAIRFDGTLGSSWLQVLLGGRDQYRLRAYVRREGTSSGHHFAFVPSGGAPDQGLVSLSYDAQIRNVTGNPWHNRYNFAAAGVSSAFPANTWWRVEYEFLNSSHPNLASGVETGDGATRTTGGGLLEIWADPASTGAPDFSAFAAGTGDATRLFFGNTNGTTGLQVLFAHLAASDGERIGPWESPSPPGGGVEVVVGGVRRPAQVAGVIVGGALRAATGVGVMVDGGVR